MTTPSAHPVADHGHGPAAHGPDAHGHDAAHGAGHHHHVPSLAKLITVWVTLMLLTGLTVVSSQIRLGDLDIIIAMTIATVKAGLVMLFFMQMWYDKPFNIVVFLSSLIFVSFFIGGTLIDSREYQHEIEQFTRGTN